MLAKLTDYYFFMKFNTKIFSFSLILLKKSLSLHNNLI
nr:MAG TPA: hypothetical protein [Caudoviricetes sp.]